LGTNDSFDKPRKTQKVTSVTPVEVLQYRDMLGNLPRRKKYSNKVTGVQDKKIIGQRFEATQDRMKAIGLYLQYDFRSTGLREVSGVLMVKVYNWNGGAPTAMNLPSGKSAEVEIDLSSVKNLDETIFELEEELPLAIGNEYYFTVVQTENFKENNAVVISTSAKVFDGTVLQGGLYTLDYSTGLTALFDPETDLVFQVYVSITELAIELVGVKGKSLSDIFDALATGLTHPYYSEYGVADFQKPYSDHIQVVLDPTNANVDGNIFAIVWSAAADVVVDLTAFVYPSIVPPIDFAIIRTTERVRIDWGETADALNCGSKYRLLEEGDTIIIPEFIDKFAFRLHAPGDTSPTISLTLWKTDAPVP